MSQAKRIIKNSGFLFFSSLTTKLIHVLFIAYASRVLGPSNFGVYALVGTFIFFFSYFTSFGIAPMSIREIARNKEKAEYLFNHVLSIRLCLILFSYMLLIATVELLQYSKEIKYLIYISGISIIFSTFTSTFQILYMAFERMAIPSIVTILNSFANAVVCIYLLYLGYGLSEIILTNVVISFFGAVLSGFWIRKIFFKYSFSFDPALWKDLMKQSIPFAFISFFQQANRHIIILFLSKVPGPIQSERAIGLFNSASASAQTAMLVPASIRQAVLPAISSNRDDYSLVIKIMDKFTKFILAFVCLPLILATTFFSKEILFIVFGELYIEASTAFMILGWAYALHAFNASANVTLSSSKEVRRLIPWSGAITLINVISAFPLIHYYSYEGASVSVLLSMMLGTFVRYYFLKSIWNIGIRDLGESAAFLIPMGAVILSGWFLSVMKASDPLFLSFLTAAYLGALFYSGIFNKKELRFINDLLNRT